MGSVFSIEVTPTTREIPTVQTTPCTPPIVKGQKNNEKKINNLLNV